MVRVGFAGEFVPRAIIRSQFLDGSVHEQSASVSGDHQSTCPKLSAMVKFFRNIFNSYLLTMPRERRVVIVESLLTPTHLRDMICEIAEGVTILSCWEVSNIGARKLENRVRELLKVHGRVEKWNEICEIKDEDWNLIEEANIIEDICVRFVFCCPLERGQAIQAQGAEHGLPSVKSVRVPLGADFLLIPGFVREAACEVIFEQNGDDICLPKMIHSIVGRCPLDLRKRMFESILVTGGPSLIPGFLHRLKAELAEAAKGSLSKLKQCESIRFYRFPDQCTEVYLPWLGGSLFGALQDAVQMRSISRETWIEDRSIPDWTDYVRHGIPCGKPELER
ncbi:Actin [Necator americanus]|uniref:Actin n=1 Tax=Necator americanus TaxID=51031 RepID=W2TPN5_NECAM|nr:Actin [Necator americanus]ETN83644.1 Actin [Necator americanus]